MTANSALLQLVQERHECILTKACPEEATPAIFGGPKPLIDGPRNITFGMKVIAWARDAEGGE